MREVTMHESEVRGLELAIADRNAEIAELKKRIILLQKTRTDVLFEAEHLCQGVILLVTTGQRADGARDCRDRIRAAITQAKPND